MKYNQNYEWAARPGLDERERRIAHETLCRIPISDLIELQKRNTKIDFRASIPSLFLVGKAEYDRKGRKNVCTVVNEPEMSDGVLAGILAHELSHVRLLHTETYIATSLTETERKIIDARHEAEAEKCAIYWGFKREVEAAQQYVDWRHEIIVENAEKFLK